MRTLKIDMSELESAMGNSFLELRYYLDAETGAVLMVTDAARDAMEEICEEIDEGDDQLADARFRELLTASNRQDWEQAGILAAYQIEYRSCDRYLPVPKQDSHTGYEDMEDFIYTARDERLQAKLRRAISGRGAFRYFKDVLSDYPAEREHWFTFSHDQERKRMLEWLESEGIAPSAEPGR